jgi:uncharacterized membrane protein
MFIRPGAQLGNVILFAQNIRKINVVRWDISTLGLLDQINIALLNNVGQFEDGFIVGLEHRPNAVIGSSIG